MIDSSFVEQIVDNAQAKAVKIEGHDYSTAELFNPPLPDEPQFPTIPLLTLDSLVDFIKANPQFDASAVLVSGATVQHVGVGEGVLRKRPVYAKVSRNFSEPDFGNFKSLEDFRIYLMTRFRPTDDREKVLVFISKVSDEHVATSEDDGVSQRVTVRSGIATQSAATVPSPLQLAPIRTFIEVEQPIGHFIFRLKQEKDKLPTAALFELPTNWEREAAVNVKTYLTGKVGTTPIYA